MRTLCDLGAVAENGVVAALRTALDDQLVTIDALRTATDEHARQGRAGIPALRRAIETWTIDHRPADSILELKFARLCRAHGLPAYTFHEQIEGWEVDFRFVGTRLIVEVDGWSTHGLDRDQFERDRVKDAALSAAGWHVLRLSYRSIVDTPNVAAQRVRSLLLRWSDPSAS